MCELNKIYTSIGQKKQNHENVAVFLGIKSPLNENKCTTTLNDKKLGSKKYHLNGRSDFFKWDNNHFYKYEYINLVI